MSRTIKIGGLELAPNTKLQTSVPVPNTTASIPLTIITGHQPGPTLLITAGIHGGEYPGILAAMELAKEIDPADLTGCLLLMHPVNTESFWQRTFALTPTDKKNLNREFPGDANGTITSKIAHFLSNTFFPQLDFYLDLHSGDLHEQLTPYVYYPGLPSAELTTKARKLALALDIPYMVRSHATTGAYNCAALNNIPSLLIERGGAGLCLRKDVEAFKKDIRNILSVTAMLPGAAPTPTIPQEVTDLIYLESTEQGCWQAQVTCGTSVEQGQVLGTLTDVFGNIITTYYAQQSGIVLYLYCAFAAPIHTTLIAYGKMV